ncbi:hypothetical protein EG328_007868 [Venturia inaequalis]|uniref:Uncharacterized protein n=1 Tax=Venturia inaequalis TaxID=5025 RepID=A0A8H3VPM2_VENIN|nr:hypothetical protein EG328_007868 [Venturia inaequalis]KAE9991498.1 hypothetical protein EG327_011594 [Venturia inaequalis]RDI89721.1 hypothetical protein Vi05172_g587 [Venturia inaequalis]
MVTPSQTITSYKGNQAAMLGWRFDTTRQRWYRTTIFWEVDSQRTPAKPPRHLRKDFVPGLKCPQGDCEKFPLNEARIFVNPDFKDIIPHAISSPSSSGSSSSTGGHSRAMGRGNPSSPLILHDGQSSRSETGAQGSALIDLMVAPLPAHREGDVVEARRRRTGGGRESPLQSQLSLSRLKIATPGAGVAEGDCIISGNDFVQRGAGSGGAAAVVMPGLRQEEEVKGDIWDFGDWKG